MVGTTGEAVLSTPLPLNVFSDFLQNSSSGPGKLKGENTKARTLRLGALIVLQSPTRRDIPHARAEQHKQIVKEIKGVIHEGKVCSSQIHMIDFNHVMYPPTPHPPITSVTSHV